ncbi:Uncharacterised protein [Chlamydia abortus]|uniref:DUF4309 domain-containing protein n=1 Tax=Paenibacillus residui TaxID=629724 RepID=A0ABW3DER8_9BACL|nr:MULTISPECIES: hypothetical protein [Paenibacillaceae]SHE13256.1 Uncharacterised protein [Chlamydia abortus]
MIKFLFFVVIITGLMTACMAPGTSVELPDSAYQTAQQNTLNRNHVPVTEGEPLPEDLTERKVVPDKEKEIIAGIKEEALYGRMKDVGTALGSTFQEIVETYGEQEGIGNQECWTYSYGHPAIDAIFYYDHDSCSGAHEPNRLQQGTVLNKISVTPELFNIQMNGKDVKEALGEPDEEYWSESYGGYYFIYDLDTYRLEFIADENSADKEVYQIDLRSLD